MTKSSHVTHPVSCDACSLIHVSSSEIYLSRDVTSANRFHVKMFKKASSEGRVTVYLAQKDYVGGHVTLVEPITLFHCRVFKKASSDGRLTVYQYQRDFVRGHMNLV